MKAKIVVGLGFGDEGKGITVDNLCREAISEGESVAVMRFSGGQQCGHTVYLDDKKWHEHGSFCSGALRGVPSYFSEHTTMYLNRLVNERKALMDKTGGIPEIAIHGLAKVTTPFDVVFGQLKEEKHRHGSVGIGIGATMHRYNHSPYKLHVVDFQHREVFMTKMDRIYMWYKQRAEKEFGVVGKVFAAKCEEHTEQFHENFDVWEENFRVMTGYSELRKYDSVIFEGSQGILLDMDHGIFPNVTYSNTTSKNAMELCELLGLRPDVYYVTRCYFTRHGNGPVPTGEPIELTNNHMEINKSHAWQGEFKVREAQPTLLRLALDYDKLYSPGVRRNLVVTCLDQRANFDYGHFIDQLPVMHKYYAINSHITRGMWLVDKVGATLS